MSSSSSYPVFPIIILLIILLIILGSVLGDRNEGIQKRDGRKWFRNGPCHFHQFRCTNDHCINKTLHCNEYDDCGDNSDERYCNHQGSATCPEGLFQCLSTKYYHNHNARYKCIPEEWKCDGVDDCYGSKDEIYCETETAQLTIRKIREAKLVAKNWTLTLRKNDSLTQKWGSDVARIAIALYLIDEDEFSQKGYKDEITYELSLRLLSRLALKRIEDVPTTEIATYVNAFLATCIDPRKFHVVDFVSELRKRVDAMEKANPFVTLALCNSGEKLTDTDVVKLIKTFWAAQEKYWIDIQALAVMALSCAATQNPTYYSQIEPLSLELKQKQYRNGTIENLKTTALVLQALFASESSPDEDNFDEDKALKQILLSQQPDGSFGNMINTYYVLPVLQGKSLSNISSSHCKKTSKSEKDGIDNLLNQVGSKWDIKYSLWIGDNKTLATTLSLKIPANISFYRAMEYAADIDPRFKFEYNVRNSKPYIYSLWNKQDDPELSMFWSLYSVSSEGEVELQAKSPSNVIPKNEQHLVFWYKYETLPTENESSVTTDK